MSRPTLLAWSSGKDSAWALHVLRHDPEVEVVGLLTTFNQAANRVAMHAVRRELVELQAMAVGLPLWMIELPWPCSNEEYEERMKAALVDAVAKNIRDIAFGDLFLHDVRAYRERQLAGTGVQPLFPLWSAPSRTEALAREMLGAGLRAVLTCVDPRQLDARAVGRHFDEAFLAERPQSVDACGERGEFHTFCFAGPMFGEPLSIQVGQVVERDGFCFADVMSISRSPQDSHEAEFLQRSNQGPSRGEGEPGPGAHPARTGRGDQRATPEEGACPSYP